MKFTKNFVKKWHKKYDCSSYCSKGKNDKKLLQTSNVCY